MAKKANDTEVQDSAADEAPTGLVTVPAAEFAALKETVQQLAADRAERGRLKDEVDRLTKLLGQGTEGQESEADKKHRDWAQLAAVEKTKLVVAERFPAKPDTKPYKVEHYDAKGKPSECFPLVINAHGVHEAEAFYRDVMGIRNTDGKFVVTLVTLAA